MKASILAVRAATATLAILVALASVFVSVPLVAEAAPLSAGKCTAGQIEVLGGQTFSGIAAAHGWGSGQAYQAFVQANKGINISNIKPKQCLNTPGTSTSAAPKAPSAAAPRNSTSSGGGTTGGKCAAGQVEVKGGQTLSGIFGGDWQKWANANGIKSPYKVYPGQCLNPPGASASPAPKAPSSSAPRAQGTTPSEPQVTLEDVKGAWEITSAIWNVIGFFLLVVK